MCPLVPFVLRMTGRPHAVDRALPLQRLARPRSPAELGCHEVPGAPDTLLLAPPPATPSVLCPPPPPLSPVVLMMMMMCRQSSLRRGIVHTLQAKEGEAEPIIVHCR